MTAGSSYHRYFEGYAERRTVDRDSGKVCWERYYADTWYVPMLTATAFRRHKAMLALVWLASAACLILAGITDCAASSHPAVVVLTLLCAVGLLVQLPSLFTLLTVKEKLTKGEWRERKNQLSLMTGLELILAISGSVRLMLLPFTGELGSVAAWSAIGYTLIAAASQYAALRLEKALPFRTEENTSAVPKDTYDIRSREISGDDE